MPELPEVEIIKNQLNDVICDRIIDNVSYKEITFKGVKIPDLNVLKNKKIKNVLRKNKYLIIYFDDIALIIHLGMTGKFYYSKKILDEKHTHFHFKLDNEYYLSYNDVRRFGEISIVNLDNLINFKGFKNLGYEPLSEDFNLINLKNLITENKNINIKKFLMSNQFICGIGNIYANEILFDIRKSPYITLNELSDLDVENLYLSIKKILKFSISVGGSSISDYMDIYGNKGNMQKYYKVYGKENSNCSICNNIIVRFSQLGRSSFFCKNCQKSS